MCEPGARRCGRGHVFKGAHPAGAGVGPLPKMRGRTTCLRCGLAMRAPGAATVGAAFEEEEEDEVDQDGTLEKTQKIVDAGLKCLSERRPFVKTLEVGQFDWGETYSWYVDGLRQFLKSEGFEIDEIEGGDDEASDSDDDDTGDDLEAKKGAGNMFEIQVSVFNVDGVVFTRVFVGPAIDTIVKAALENVQKGAGYREKFPLGKFEGREQYSWYVTDTRYYLDDAGFVFQESGRRGIDLWATKRVGESGTITVVIYNDGGDVYVSIKGGPVGA